MKVFIVLAHHEPTSFSHALTRAGQAALEAAGHEVQVSDLYAMAFDPVSDRRNFITVADAGRFSQQTEEAHASAQQGYAPELQAEMDKLDGCDVLIFQFPLWWLGLPAILKGWVDKVLAVGRAYGGGRYFDQGLFAGKRALCALTVGGPEPVYSGWAFTAASKRYCIQSIAAFSVLPVSPSSSLSSFTSLGESAPRSARPI